MTQEGIKDALLDAYIRIDCHEWWINELRERGLECGVSIKEERDKIIKLKEQLAAEQDSL